tara:strand:+ start:553 stop:1230 length:678 start_codon:yes stop_codon:yes gene_type:complete
MTEKIKAAYDAIADRYDSEYDDPQSVAENEIVKTALIQTTNYSEQIFDAGCGTGLALRLMPWITAPRYFGVDLSVGMLARLKAGGHDVAFARDDAWSEAGIVRRRRMDSDALISLFGAPSYAPMGRVLGATCERRRRFLLMPYAEGTLRYHEKACHTEQFKDLRYTYSAGLWRGELARRGARNVQVRGLTLLTPLPAALRSTEYKLLGRLMPDRGRWLVITGEMP